MASRYQPFHLFLHKFLAIRVNPAGSDPRKLFIQKLHSRRLHRRGFSHSLCYNICFRSNIASNRDIKRRFRLKFIQNCLLSTNKFFPSISSVFKNNRRRIIVQTGHFKGFDCYSSLTGTRKTLFV